MAFLPRFPLIRVGWMGVVSHAGNSAARSLFTPRGIFCFRFRVRSPDTGQHHKAEVYRTNRLMRADTWCAFQGTR